MNQQNQQKERTDREKTTAESPISLRLEDLSVGYNKKPLIREINLTVKQGEILTLIGPNGAGKSTILKSIAGQLKPLGGVVYLRGENMDGLTRVQVAKTLSMVMTTQPATELMTCRDVVATGRYPYTGRMGILSLEDWNKVDECLKLVRGSDVAERDFMKLSDGQRQRILLARALCQEPKVLILDEPTSYLDIRYKLEILTLIREIARARRLAVIASLHELDLARKVSDYIACVKDGCIGRIGEPEQIFRDDYISRLYQIERGSFTSVSGLPQLPGMRGDARVFVIGGGGSAVDTYYKLQRQGIAFAAGILPANDVECSIVKALATEALIAPAYSPPDEAMIRQAKGIIKGCDKVLCKLEGFGYFNSYNAELLEYARSQGKLSGE